LTGRPLLASAGDDGVRVWDPDTGDPVGQPLTEHTGWVESVAFGTGAGGRPLLASGADDRTVRVWDPDTGAQLLIIRRRTPATALASDGSRFAVGDEEGLSVIDIG
jgi:WD40 repeat protein